MLHRVLPVLRGWSVRETENEEIGRERDTWSTIYPLNSSANIIPPFHTHLDVTTTLREPCEWHVSHPKGIVQLTRGTQWFQIEGIHPDMFPTLMLQISMLLKESVDSAIILVFYNGLNWWAVGQHGALVRWKCLLEGGDWRVVARTSWDILYRSISVQQRRALSRISSAHFCWITLQSRWPDRFIIWAKR